VGVVVAVVIVVVAAVLLGAPGPGPFRRAPARDLVALADRIDDVCGTADGSATVDWIGGRVDHPNGAPLDLTEDQQAMLGSGSKVGCIEAAIS
jgi:hypothetical protein